MYYQYPLETLARMRGTASQADFAREAARIVFDTDDVMAQPCERGLAIFAANEEVLSQPSRLLGDVFGPRLELRRPKVRRMPGNPSREPIMHVDVTVRPEYAARVVAELRARGVIMLEECRRARRSVVQAEAPLAALLGMSARLDCVTAGSAECSLRLVRYAPVDRDGREKRCA